MGSMRCVLEVKNISPFLAKVKHLICFSEVLRNCIDGFKQVSKSACWVRRNPFNPQIVTLIDQIGQKKK